MDGARREPDTEIGRRGGLDVLEIDQSLERMIWRIFSQYAEPAGTPRTWNTFWIT